MNVEEVSYAGWKRCLRISNDEIEAIVTLDVGPRIIRCGFVGGVNEFVEYPEQIGKTGENIYRSYGGHRLWVAPEQKPRTYYPDNNPVTMMKKGETIRFRAPAEVGTGVQKEIRVTMSLKMNSFHVEHFLTNNSEAPLTAAAWALSVMAPGGRAIIPQEQFKPHPEILQPVRGMALWSYTDMTDPRWTWGKKFVQLRQDSSLQTPQKFGVLNKQGWCAYTNGDRLFLKTVPFSQNAAYPDFDCNCEFFTNHRMLELETLSPLKTLQPGETIQHDERWFLFRNIHIGTSDDDIATAFHNITKSLSK
jgi:hypothetical protein